MITKKYGDLMGQAVRQRLSQAEHEAQNRNADMAVTRRCAYPKSVPALAGSCECWKCHNDRGRARFAMLRTGPQPEPSYARHKRSSSEK